jgi:hypothetical protein
MPIGPAPDRAYDPGGAGSRVLQQLPGTPWAIRAAGSSGGRTALETYAAGTLMDVMVAQSLAPQTLRL